MENKKTIFFLSKDLDSHKNLIELLEAEFNVNCFHKSMDMTPEIKPGSIPDVFIFDYSEEYTSKLSEAVKAVKKVDRCAIIFGLYNIFDETDGKQALIDGCTDIINCMDATYIVNKSVRVCNSKASITKRIRRLTHTL